MNPAPQSTALAAKLLRNYRIHTPAHGVELSVTPKELAHMLDAAGVRKLVEALEAARALAWHVANGHANCGCDIEGRAGRVEEKCIAALATEPSGAQGETISTKGGDETCLRPACNAESHTRSDNASASKGAGNVPPEPRADNEATPETDSTRFAMEVSNPDKRSRELLGHARSLERQRNAAIAERDELQMRLEKAAADMAQARADLRQSSEHRKAQRERLAVLEPLVPALRAELSTLKAERK